MTSSSRERKVESEKLAMGKKDANWPSEKHQNLSERFLQFAVRVIRIAAALPNDEIGRTIRSQMADSGTSSGANYEEACGAESRPDFIHKMLVVLKELRETRYWLRLIIAAELLPESRLADVCKEADELISITVTSVRTARRGASNA
jgi:four helix bundle protein